MDAKELSRRLKESIDWDLFFTLTDSVGADLNPRKLRFLKSDFFEMAIERYSDGSVNWVDQVGFDHLFEGKIKIEMKYHQGSLFANKGKGKKREHVGEIALKNTQSGGKSRRLDKTFDFLLVVDKRSAAIIDFDLLIESSYATDDQIKVVKNSLSTERIHFIVEPFEVDVQSVSMSSFLDDLRMLQVSHIDRLKKEHSQQKPDFF